MLHPTTGFIMGVIRASEWVVGGERPPNTRHVIIWRWSLILVRVTGVVELIPAVNKKLYLHTSRITSKPTGRLWTVGGNQRKWQLTEKPRSAILDSSLRWRWPLHHPARNIASIYLNKLIIKYYHVVTVMMPSEHEETRYLAQGHGDRYVAAAGDQIL